MKNFVSNVPFCLIFLALSACSEGLFPSGFQGGESVVTPSAATISPNVDPSPSRGEAFKPPVRPVLDLSQTLSDVLPPPSENARTVEDFDTTTVQDRAEAVGATPDSSERQLGVTIASLGSPVEPGIWFKTPLVVATTQGRIDYNGKSVVVELRPSGGAAGSGSQISLAAMRLIEAPLTGLPEVTVYAY